jgi:hypothetical protein
VKRVVIPELLDSDSGQRSEIDDALHDLRQINRWFGGISTTLAMLDRVIERSGARELSLLDVASGSADVPRAAVSHGQRRGVQIRTTVLDRVFAHLTGNGSRALVGDALHLPFAGGAFDVVSCGLFAHHLEPGELTEFVREAARVARLAVLINDLVRSRLHLAMVYAGLPLWRSRITRHDSLASVRRAYTPDEIRELLAPVARGGIEITRHYLFRIGVIAWTRHV